jgi:hypothetical protein
MVLGAFLLSVAFAPMSTTLGADDGNLVSHYTETAPTLDGVADEAAWADAEELVISVAGGDANGDITLKSVFTDTDVYVYAEWDDPTMSLTRGGGAWEHNPLPEDTMRAVFTDEAPEVDGDISDEAWDAADPLTIAVAGGTMPGDITLRALYDSDNIYIQKTWDDPTFSIARGGSWSWDNVEQMWRTSSGHSEDRANIQWDIDATGFADQGCMVKCHIDSYSYLDNPDDITDMWHMKAARSLPANGASQVGTPTLDGLEATAGEFHLDGWSDDKHVTYDENMGAEGDGGRHGDEGSSTYGRNRNATKAAPKFIETDPDDWIDAMVLLQSEIDDGETITADPAEDGYSGTDVAAAWAKYDALGAVVPERILREPEGSRGDIHEAAIWKDGTWTVELERKLVTENDDDVQFDDMMRTYSFGVATIDNGGGEDHNYHSGAYHMVFAPEFEKFGSGSEDRLAILFEMGTITNFASDGCMVKCHPSDGSAGAYLEVDGEMGDIWHMKAARSLPVTMATQTGTVNVNDDHQATSGTFTFKGYVDDKHLTYDEAPHEDDGGRHGDDGSSTYGRNRNSERTGPLYLEKDPLDYLDAMVLTQAEIDNDEVLVVATATAEELEHSWEHYEEFGALIPERILREPAGSRADITQAAVWSDGTWTTEIKRSLVTGNSDDVQFDDLDATYRFGVALMDDSGGGDHSTTGTDTYLLEFFTPPTEYVLMGGPITDKKGNPVEGALVTLDKDGTTLTGTTDADGNVTITVPADWADNAVTVTVTKDGYDDAEFGGSISADGVFSPTGGSYPDFIKEKKEDESPGFTIVVMMIALTIALMVAMTARRK